MLQKIKSILLAGALAPVMQQLGVGSEEPGAGSEKPGENGPPPEAGDRKAAGTGPEPAFRGQTSGEQEDGGSRPGEESPVVSPEPGSGGEGTPNSELQTPNSLNSELPTPDSPAPEARLSLMEGLLLEKDEEIRQANTRAGENEKALTDANARIAGLEKSAAESGENAGRLDRLYNQAVRRYKELLIEANPGVLPEMIGGETIEEADQSLEKARELIDRVKQSLEDRAAAVRVPAGAPQRSSPDLSGLSSREKIVRGIEKG